MVAGAFCGGFKACLGRTFQAFYGFCLGERSFEETEADGRTISGSGAGSRKAELREKARARACSRFRGPMLSRFRARARPRSPGLSRWNCGGGLARDDDGAGCLLAMKLDLVDVDAARHRLAAVVFAVPQKRFARGGGGGA